MNALQADPVAAPGDRFLPWWRWLAEGLRAGLLLPARVGGHRPTPWQVAALVLLLTAVELGLGRLEIAGPARFDLQAWLAPWWGTAALLLVVWWALAGAARAGGSAGLAAWFALWTAALLPVTLVSLGLGIAQTQERLPAWLAGGGWTAWALYFGLWGWLVVAGLRLAWGLGARPAGLAGLAAGLLGVFALTAWQFPDRPWVAQPAGLPDAPRLELSQETFEAQQAAWQRAVDGLAAQREDVVDVYGLVFAPYAGEDVFLRESGMVASLLAERFDARGRVLHLVNHATTATTHPWATPLNLRRAVQALAARMDTGRDLLVVYLTSHGASDHRLAASHWPLAVQPLSPGELRDALDQAGIRHRVIAVSACYSGGWIGPLAGERSLVMTAADAMHTSYGCGRLSELTFFGRAVFDEQLRRTHSFEAAFGQAVPLIREREVQAGKPDGFSNPQISVGEGLRPLLGELEQRLRPRD
ncbi:C13 family peptidase [Ramlibacter tataouinensis]|uniref:Candidate membrane protein n=1 Tax=Ramlibacter tataouinensis (strain ATCC BAA-407 / DSM 14655 / LMG 21543 / TTB310) TaxID=365046 RepID=F5XWL1_RAMTT|nr:C13 family peptidase [Ramlibacter tataouinensis]AEG94155.1 candidate membrane protein [Ramlibacter tataouinensis TTB310]